VKTKQAILIGVYGDPVQPGEATKVVEALADYLISVSYVSPFCILQCFLSNASLSIITVNDGPSILLLFMRHSVLTK
jgi:hypothetical protein